MSIVMQVREVVKKGPFSRPLLLRLLVRGLASPPLTGPWTIKILGPYFNVAVNAIGLLKGPFLPPPLLQTV